MGSKNIRKIYIHIFSVYHSSCYKDFNELMNKAKQYNTREVVIFPLLENKGRMCSRPRCVGVCEEMLYFDVNLSVMFWVYQKLLGN